MNQEIRRLATFTSWPETAKASPVRLAKAGLYFNGQGDTAVCFRCSSLLDNWKDGDDPLERHRHRASNCPIVLGNDKENVPLQLYELNSNYNLSHHRWTINNDTCPDNAAGDTNIQNRIGLLSVYNTAFSRAQKSAIFSVNFLHVDRTNPDFDQLRRESVRLSTFHDWPPRAHAQPAELARDGFFFTGLDDRVQCAFCRGFLRNWVPGDKPADEHKKHFPDCPLVRGLDIANILEETHNQLTKVGTVC